MTVPKMPKDVWALSEKRKEKKPHVTNNTGKQEWYTPEHIIKAATKVLGTIALDPASSEMANRIVKAERIYTAEDDGLSKEWHAETLWLNPPYTRSLVGRFVDKLLESLESGKVGRAIVLVNNATETAFGQKLLSARYFPAVCFPKGRIRFIDGSGEPTGAPLQGQMIVMLQSVSKTSAMDCTKGVGLFTEVFSSIGVCLCA